MSTTTKASESPPGEERRREAPGAGPAAEQRAEKLHQAAAALARAATCEEVGAAVVEQASAALGASAAVAYYMQRGGDLRMTAARGIPPDRVAALEVLPLDAPVPLADAIRTGQPLWIESYQELVARYPGLGASSVPVADLQAIAAIPLRGGDRTVGGVGFSFSSPRRFDDEERRFLLTVVSHATVATERCILREEEAAARNRLAVLAAASRRFAEARLELRDTLDIVAREVAERLRGACAINLVSADGQVLEPLAVAHVDPEVEEAIRQTLAAAPIRMADDTSPARVARSGQPILIPTIPEGLFASTGPVEYREHHRRYPLGSLLIVPLSARGATIGTVTVARGVEGPAYTADDQLLLEDLAARAALAIANARQHEELAVERRRLDMLARASELLATSLDYETTLRNVIELALPTLGDFGFFDVREADDTVRRVARAYRNPERQRQLDQTSWARSDRRDKVLCALSTGTSGFHPWIDEEWLLDVAVSPQHLELMRQLAFGSMITVPLSYHGDVLGSLTLFFDRDRRRHTESDLRLAEELARRAAAAVRSARLFREVRQAVAVRDDFLSIAGHELNTPLAALQLQIQSLKRQAEKEATARFLERLTKAEGQVGRLEKLVSELLDVSRITAGRLSIEREPMDLVAAVREAVDRLAAPAANAGCELRVAGPDRLPGMWDRLRVEQVVTNLLTNAFKYGSGRPVEVTVTREGASARIAVRDHGIGISPEDEARIFGRFERAVPQRHYGGFGLGLWIARQIVEAHGGTIRFERPADAGTRFIVELPVEGAAMRGPP